MGRIWKTSILVFCCCLHKIHKGWTVVNNYNNNACTCNWFCSTHIFGKHECKIEVKQLIMFFRWLKICDKWAKIPLKEKKTPCK